MNGVTILRSYEVLIGHGPGWSWGGLCLSILALAIIAISMSVRSLLFVGFIHTWRNCTPLFG